MGQLDSFIENNDSVLGKIRKTVEVFKESEMNLEILEQTRELEAEIRQRREKLPISTTASQTEGFSFDQRTLRHRLEVEISLDVIGMIRRGIEIGRTSVGDISKCRSPHA